MTESRFSTPAPIGDELLSAYIDGQVTAAERQRVEQALATDVQFREQYETLQMTVTLMQNAPPVRVPRAFVLSEAQVLAAGGKMKGVKQPSFFERIFPRMMPLATAAVALLLVVLVSVDFLPGFTGSMNAPQPAIQEMEIAAAPAQEMAAPREMTAEESVELVKEVELTVLVEKEVLATVLVEELVRRKDTTTEDAVADEAPAARAAAKSSAEANASAVAEAPMAAAPPPAPDVEMAEDTEEDAAEPIMESDGESTEAFGTGDAVQATPLPDQSPVAATNIAQASPVGKSTAKPTWLRPLEFLLALLLLCLLVGTLLLRKRTRTDTP